MKTVFRTVLAVAALSLTACLPTTGGSHESRIQVYKHDGSRQCEAGISPADMQKELQGIRVYAAERKKESFQTKPIPKYAEAIPAPSTFTRLKRKIEAKLKSAGLKYYPQHRNNLFRRPDHSAALKGRLKTAMPARSSQQHGKIRRALSKAPP